MITFLLTLPRWVYALIATLLILIGTYFYGHHSGWYERDAEMQAEIARMNEQARATERRLTDELNSHATQLQDANHALDEKSSALDRAIRAGRVRLPFASCAPAAAGAAAAGGDRAETRAEPDRPADEAADAERETLRLIAQIAADGDRAINQLNACIDAYNEVRKQINGSDR